MNKRKKVKQIVTRDTLRTMLNNPNRKYVETVVGRALVALLKRQTTDEQASAETRVHNSIGFSGADAHSGTLTAKTWNSKGVLLDWQLNKWLKPAKNGYPRLCKYAKQLNEIALENGS